MLQGTGHSTVSPGGWTALLSAPPPPPSVKLLAGLWLRWWLSRDSQLPLKLPALRSAELGALVLLDLPVYDLGHRTKVECGPAPPPHGGRPVPRRPLVRMAAPGPLALPSRVSGWGSGTQCSHCRTCWGPSAQAQSPGAGRQPSPLISWRNGGLPRGTGARGWVTEASDHLPRLKPHSWARAERGRGALSPGPHLPGAGGTGWQVKGQGPQTPALLREA